MTTTADASVVKRQCPNIAKRKRGSHFLYRRSPNLWHSSAIADQEEVQMLDGGRDVTALPRIAVVVMKV